MKLVYAATHLRKYYGGRLALNLPEFELGRGEAVVLTGANGSGKSTLLRLLAFLESPSSGELQFFGSQDAPRRQITLLLQEPYLFKDTVMRNVTLGLILRGQRNGLAKAYEAAMRKAGFQEPSLFAARRPNQLSGGEKQRVALASRLILEPLALLLDEPTSNVDAASGRAIIAALAAFRANGGSLVCATHDPSLVSSLHAREIALHNHG